MGTEDVDFYAYMPRVWAYALQGAGEDKIPANDPVVYQLLTIYAVWRRGMNRRISQAHYN